MPFQNQLRVKGQVYSFVQCNLVCYIQVLYFLQCIGSTTKINDSNIKNKTIQKTNNRKVNNN